MIDRPSPLFAALRYAAIAFIAAFLLLPIYWLIMSSFRPAGDIFRHAGQFSLETLIPQSLTLENYRQTAAGGFPLALRNSLFISISTVIMGLLVNSMAGFAFAVFDFPGKNALFVAVLLSFMMPFEAIVIPLYALMRGLGWNDTFAALILPDVASGLVVFLFRQYFAGIPKEIYEAARIDGAGWWQIYWRMTLPLSGATMATASLMMFIHQWDAFFWPLVAASSADLAVVQVAIARNMTLEQANWGALFASASTAVLVALVPFLALQRYFIRTVAIQSDK
ncbi:MAG: carbohydrate ABC transporter permease [Hyphomicrobiaceae bacterium]|nr:MAG: carbohydrate ABC transporter permease [Hyphomicrobiaceae bacterium]